METHDSAPSHGDPIPRSRLKLLECSVNLDFENSTEAFKPGTGSAPRRSGILAGLSLRKVVNLGTPCLVVLGVLAWWASRPTPERVEPGPEPVTAVLARLFSSDRQLHGRVSRGPSIELTPSPPAAALPFSPWDPLLSLQAKLERELTAAPSVEALHATGLLRLYEERLDEAVELLSAAALLSPGAAGVRGDLSAALLERGLGSGARNDFLEALHAAVEGLELAPDHPALVYDFALALDELGLEHRAAAAWEAYLAIDPASEWASEARSRLRTLDLTSSKAEWALLRRQIEDRLADDALEEAGSLVRTRSSTARKEVAEVVLGEWATAQESGVGTEAEHLLALARVVGEVSEAQDGDHLVRDSMRAIHRARATEGELLRTTIIGHRQLAEGIRSRRAGDCDAARAPLADAAVRLHEGGSPLAELARLNWAICLYSSDAQTALPLLGEITSRLRGRNYPWLEAQAEWMHGLAMAATGAPWPAIERYHVAIARFDASNDASGSAGARTVAAEAYRQLGQYDRAWQETLEALAVLGAAGDSVGLDRVLDEAVLALAREGRVATALVFQSEQIEHARRSNSPAISLPTQLILRAGLFRQAERYREALRTIEEARALCAPITDSAARERLEANLALEEALILARTDPSAALEKFETGLDSFDTSGYRLRLPELLHARSVARAASGDPARAEADLSTALAEIDRRQRSTEPTEIRISAFESFQPVYDTAIRFYLDSMNDPIRALELADRAKSRELRAGTGGSGRSPRVADWQAEMAEGTVLVEYAVLPDRLSIWAVTREAVEHQAVDVTSRELQRQVDLFVGTVANGGSAETSLRFAGELFDLLLRPLGTTLKRASSVVFVPDRGLVTVPFRVLYDRENERHLLQTHRVAVAPSASMLSRSSAKRVENPSLLAIGNPALDRRAFPQLESLPWAEEEARRISGLYAVGEALIGEAATRDGVVAGLPGVSVLHLGSHTRPAASHSTEILLAPARPDEPAKPLAIETLDPVLVQGLEVAFVSACSGAVRSPEGGREGLRGPARSLLAAGVPAVIASLWPIDDRASAEIAIGFHEHLVAGASPAEALRLSQMESLATASPHGEGSAAHWGAFELFVTEWPSKHE